MKKIYYTAVILAASMFVLTACGNTKAQENKEAYRQLGMKCMQEEDYEGAIDAFQKALDQSVAVIGEEEIDTCYYKAAAQYEAGRVEDAIQTYQALIDYDKKNEEAYYLLGTLYLKEQDTKKALENYNLATEYAKDNYEVYIAVYQQCSMNDLTQEGTTYLKKGLTQQGKSADDYAQRGRIYLLLGDYENAKEQLTTAIDKKSVTAPLYMAQLYECEGDKEKAGQLYESYIESNKEDPIALNSLGCIRMENADYAGAIENFEMALALEQPSNEQQLRRNLIMAYEQNGDFTKAKEAMETYTKDYPKDTEAAREYLFLQTR